MVEKGSGSKEEKETRNVLGSRMTSNLSDRQRVSMTNKGNVRQGLWQERGLKCWRSDSQG
jgi:hypothetical protein